MVYKCLVPTCNTTGGMKRRVTLHKFPKNEDQARKWLQSIGMPSYKITGNSVVCRNHFLKTDYEYRKSRISLKPEALPRLSKTAMKKLEAVEAKPGARARKGAAATAGPARRTPLALLRVKFINIVRFTFREKSPENHKSLITINTNDPDLKIVDLPILDEFSEELSLRYGIMYMLKLRTISKQKLKLMQTLYVRNIRRKLPEYIRTILDRKFDQRFFQTGPQYNILYDPQVIQ